MQFVVKNLPSWFPGAWFIRYANSKCTRAWDIYVLLPFCPLETRPEFEAIRRYGFDEVRREMVRFDTIRSENTTENSRGTRSSKALIPI